MGIRIIKEIIVPGRATEIYSFLFKFFTFFLNKAMLSKDFPQKLHIP